MSISDKNTNPYNDLENIIDIDGGTETNIQIQRSIFYKYPKPYSNCDFEDNEGRNQPPSSFDLTYYNQVIQAGYWYSQSICLDFCRSDLLNKRGDCTIFSTSLRLPSHTKYCPLYNFTQKSLYIQFSQFLNAVLHEKSDPLYLHCQKLCPLECRRVQYENFIQTAKITPSILEVYRDELNRTNRIFNASLLDQDLVLLKIYFGQM